MNDMTKNIILIGFMGSGKTTVGKVLAREAKAIESLKKSFEAAY